MTDDSYLTIARLLPPLVTTLGSSRTAMSAKNMSKSIAVNLQFKKGVVYGPRECNGSQDYPLDLASEIRPANKWEGGRHPDGITYRHR